LADAIDALRIALADRYAVEREVGRGGMATVYAARDLKHARLVAIKVLRSDIAASLGADRFLREIQLAAQLQHPHILPLHDSGEAGGLLYYVMPFVEGESLRDRLVREKQLPLDEALRITREVADAIDYAHRRGVIHRDIKPENILLSSAHDGHGGHALVADFGIARAVTSSGGDTLTQAGIAVGTPAYMSPEQASADPSVDGRTDVYSLGCVLYEMLAGHAPFLGATAHEVLARHLHDPVPPIRTVRPDLDPTVESAVSIALAKSPADRYATASAFGRALGHVGAPPVIKARGSLLMVGIGIAAVVAVAYLVFWRGNVSTPRSDAEAGAVTSIAVLPFDNIGGDPRNEPFSDGVAEDITTELRKVSRLNVKARTSAFSFKGRNLTAQEIGSRLGAGYVLAGSVQLTGNRRRVHAQLIDVSSGNELWSDKYDSDAGAGDIFAVQDSMTRAIVTSLRIPLSTSESASLEKRATMNREAHDLYLQGRYFFEKRDSASLARARDFFERAIALDPIYARAWAGLSDAFSHNHAFELMPREAVYARARAAALRALEIDSMLVEAHVSRGFVALFLEWDLATAERSLNRAIELDPDYAPGHQFKAWSLIAANRPGEAVDEMRDAQRLDPFSMVINARVATMLFYSRRYSEAIAQAQRNREMDSTFFSAFLDLLRALPEVGRCDEALALMERYPRAVSLLGATHRGYVYARCDRRDQATAELRRLRALATEGGYVHHHGLAMIEAGLGNVDAAVRELGKALEDRTWWLFTTHLDPAFDQMRDDPRFRSLLRRIGPAS